MAFWSASEGNVSAEDALQFRLRNHSVLEHGWRRSLSIADRRADRLRHSGAEFRDLRADVHRRCLPVKAGRGGAGPSGPRPRATGRGIGCSKQFPP